MKNIIRFDNYYSPEGLSRSICEFVKHYNNERYHKSIGNLTPADVYYGRDQKIVSQRIKTKKKTLSEGRKNYIIEKLKLVYEIL